MPDRNNLQDEVQNGVNQMGDAAKNGAKKILSKTSGKIKRYTKTLVKKAVKVIGKLVVKAVSTLLTYLWPVVIVVVLIAILALSFREVYYNDFATNQRYTENVTISKDSSSSIEDVMMLLFYTKYSVHSYYYTVDGSEDILQASTKEVILDDSGKKIEDIDGRDTMFALNPSLLYVMDKYLNDGVIAPAQFTKPVYNTCSTGESKMDACKTKDLVDDKGNLIAESAKYEKKEEGYYARTNEKTKGVWDWGFAPIIHYKKFKQESQVQDYNVYSFDYFDVETNEVKTMLMDNYESLSDEEKEKYKDFVKEASKEVSTVINRGDSEDNGNIPEDDTVYAIDNVATMFGTITNDFDIEWVYQNDYINKSNPVVWEGYSKVDNDDDTLLVESIPKKVYFQGNIISAKKVEFSLNDENVSDFIKSEAHKYATQKANEALDEYLKEFDKNKEGNNSDNDLNDSDVNIPNNPNINKPQERTIQQRNITSEEKEDKVTQEMMDAVKSEAYKKAYIEYIEPGYIITKTDNSQIYIKGGKGLFSKNGENYIEALFKVDLYTVRKGRLMKKTANYRDEEPNVSRTFGLKYLLNYLHNYEVYLPLNDTDNKGNQIEKIDVYACQPITDGKIKEALKAELEKDNGALENLYGILDIDKIQKNLKEVTDKNAEVVTPDVLNSLSNGEYTKEAVLVAKPSHCPRDTIAIKQSLNQMSEFGVAEYPTLQLLTIAKFLGYNPQAVDGSVDLENGVLNEGIIDTGIVSDADLSGGSSTENDTDEITSQRYLNEIKSSAKEFGLDANLLFAVIKATSQGNADLHKNVCDGSNSQGCGLMGIKTNNFEGGANLKAYSYVHRRDVTYSEVAKGDKSYITPENNIIYGAMLLQRYLAEYDYNFLVAIQAYSYGYDNMEEFLKFYLEKATDKNGKKEEVLSDDFSYDWTAYRETFDKTDKGKNKGDIKFAEKVLLSLGSVDTISAKNVTTIQKSEYESFDFKYLKDISTTDKSEEEALRYKLMNLYLKVGKKYKGQDADAIWKKYWNFIYAGQKSFDDGMSYVPINKEKEKDDKLIYVKHEYKDRNSESDILSVIYTAFGFAEGKPMDSYEDLDEEYWKTKISSMFKTAGSKSWGSNYDLAATFSEEVLLPVSQSVITNEFGWQERGGVSYSYSPTTTILGAEQEPVKAMVGGVVTSISKNGLDTTLTIMHNDGSGESLTDDDKDKDKNKDKDKDEDKDEKDSKEDDKSDRPNVGEGLTMTGRFSDVKKMGYTKKEAIALIKKRYTDFGNSMLKGGNYAEWYVDYCEKQDVNPFLVAAISIQETGNLTSVGATEKFNFGGMMQPDGKGGQTLIVYPSIKEGLMAHIELLHDYIFERNQNSIYEIGSSYCEPPDGWIKAVGVLYKEVTNGYSFGDEGSEIERKPVNKEVSITYHKLVLKSDIKVGDIIEAGDIIGKVPNTGTFELSLTVDGKTCDIGEVIRAVQDLNTREMSYIGRGGNYGNYNFGDSGGRVPYKQINTRYYLKDSVFQGVLVGQCTWYAWGRFYQVHGERLASTGNARTWCDSAKESGWKIGMTPSAGAVAVYDDSSHQYGHVMFVESYDKDGVVKMSEGNFNRGDGGPTWPDGTLETAHYLTHYVEFEKNNYHNIYGNLTLKCFIYPKSQE